MCELDVEIFDERRVILDELAAEGGAFAHQDREHLIRLDGVLHAHLDERSRRGVHRRIPQLFGAHLAEALIALIGDFVVVRRVVGGLLFLRIEVDVLLPLDARLVEGRHRRIDVPVLDERAHIAEEEGEEQNADMRAVDVGIRHGDDAVVAQLALVEIVQNAATEGGDHRLDLRVFEHAVEPHLLDVENFTAEGQDGLEAPVSARFCGTACRIALDDINFAQLGAAVGTVGELAGERARFQNALSPREFAGGTGGVARLLRRDAAKNKLARFLRVLLDIGAEAVGNALAHKGAHEAVVELILGLRFELRVLELDGDDGGDALAHVLAREAVVLL